jgi:hypothetical protein
LKREPDFHFFGVSLSCRRKPAYKAIAATFSPKNIGRRVATKQSVKTETRDPRGSRKTFVWERKQQVGGQKAGMREKHPTGRHETCMPGPEE